MKYVVLIGRILFSAVFLLSAPMHFTKAYFDYGVSMGVPMPYILVPLSGLIAFIGALSILLGFRARIGAWFIIVFLIPVTLTMHNFWGGHETATEAVIQKFMFMKNLSMLGGALLIAYFGSGPYSIDKSDYKFKKKNK